LAMSENRESFEQSGPSGISLKARSGVPERVAQRRERYE
jgi:hypothetical protein